MAFSRVIPIIVAVALLPVALLGGLLSALQSPVVQQRVAGALAAATPVRLEGLSVVWPLDLQAARLSLVDDRGVWLTASQVHLDWRPAALLTGRLHIRRLTAARLDFDRLPRRRVAAPRQPPGLPRLPVGLWLDQFSVDSLGVAAGVARLPVEGRLSASGRLAGGRLQLAAVLAAASPVGHGEAHLAADGAGTAMRFEGQGTFHDLPVAVNSVAWAVAGSLDLVKGDASLGHLRLLTDRGQASAFGWLYAWGRQIRLHVAADLPDMAAVVPQLRGAVRLTGEVAGPLAGPRLVVTATPAGLATGIGDLDRLLGPMPRVRAAIALGGPGGWPFFVDVAGQGGTARAGGLLGRRPFAGLRVRIDEAAPLTGEAYHGWVEADGLLSGSSADPILAARGEAAGLFRQRPIKGHLLVAARQLTRQPQGRGELFLSSQGIDAEATAKFLWGPVWRFDEVAVRSGGDHLAGHLAWDPAAKAVAGRLEGEVAALHRWASLLGTDVGGAARVDVRLMPGRGQQVQFNVQGDHLTYAGLTARSLTADGRVADVLGQADGRITLTVGGVNTGRLSLDSVRLDADGGLGRAVARLSAHGDAGGRPLALQAAGTLRPRAGDYGITALDLAIDRNHLRLLAPTDVFVRAAEIRLAATRLALAEGRLEASGALANGGLNGHLHFTRMPLDMAAPLLPKWQPKGLVAGEVTVGGTSDAPRLAAVLEGRNIDLAGHRTAIGLSARAAWDSQRLQASVDASGVNGSHVTARADFPLTYATGQLEIPFGPVTGRVEGNADLGRLAVILPLGDEIVAGQVTIHATVTGDAEQPAVDARVEVRQGVYRNFDTGTSLSGIILTATAQDSRHVAIEASGDDGARGRFTAAGQADLAEGPWFAADVTLADLRLANLDLVRGQASGRLHLEGIGRQAGLSGSVAVDEADIDIGQSLPARIVTLDVVEINGPPRPPPPPRAHRTAPFALSLAVDAGLQHVHVRGRGLDSEWQGRLTVGGTASRATVVGQLTSVRGSYDLFGRRLTLAQGTIAFDGEYPPNPRLDLTAQGPARDVTAQVRVTGTADKPEFAFTSDPPVPRDEVLARLLFGSDAGQLSVTQQITLARAAAGQLGGGGGASFDPLGRLRDALGLDVLEAGGDTTNDFQPPGLPPPPSATTPGGPSAPVAGMGNTGRTIGPSLSAGKYLNERTFLRVDQGTTGGRVTVEVELGGGFAIDTRLGENTGGGVGVSWKKDY